jgi:hypothetical protein
MQSDTEKYLAEVEEREKSVATLFAAFRETELRTGAEDLAHVSLRLARTKSQADVRTLLEIVRYAAKSIRQHGCQSCIMKLERLARDAREKPDA